MKKLSTNQTNWIMVTVKNYVDKWISLSPLKDEMWKDVAKEAEDIMRRGRDDRLLLDMMVAGLSYIEYINKER